MKKAALLIAAVGAVIVAVIAAKRHRKPSASTAVPAPAPLKLAQDFDDDMSNIRINPKVTAAVEAFVSAHGGVPLTTDGSIRVTIDALKTVDQATAGAQWGQIQDAIKKYGSVGR